MPQWRLTQLAFGTLQRVIAPAITVAQWQALGVEITHRLREGPRRRPSQATRALTELFLRPGLLVD